MQNTVPSGFRDLNADEVRQRQRIVDTVLQHCTARGYAHIDPPLVEFATAKRNGFTFFDPISLEQLWLRDDITPQIGRIAAGKDRDAPRPLRYSYAGAVVRRVSSSLKVQRQFCQIGCEVIGLGHPSEHSASEDTAVDVLSLAFDSLDALGIHDLTLDIAFPHMLDAIIEGISEARRDEFRQLVRARRLSALRKYLADADVGTEAAALLWALQLPTQLDATRASLKDGPPMQLNPQSTAQLAELCRRAHRLLGAIAPIESRCRMHVDALETRGYSYQSGFGFTLFSDRVRSAVGRGGMYVTDAGESAFGFSLYADTLAPLMAAG